MLEDILLTCASDGNLAAVKATLEANPDSTKALLNACDANGDTPLMLAAWLGHTAVVEFLASLPETPLNAANNNGATAYLLAAAGGHENIMTILARTAGVNTKTRDKFNADAAEILRRFKARNTTTPMRPLTAKQRQNIAILLALGRGNPNHGMTATPR